MKTLLTYKKSLGQNFLIDKNIINKIIEIGNINKNKTVMEIGAGYGNLTKAIVRMKPKKILAVEKDEKLAFFLKKKLIFYLFQPLRFFLAPYELLLLLNSHSQLLSP